MIAQCRQRTIPVITTGAAGGRRHPTVIAVTDLAFSSHDRLPRLYNITVAEPISSQTAQDWWTLREGEIRVTMLAEDEHGTVTAYSDVDRETWMKPGHFYIRVIVAPEARCQGLGSQMYEAALQTACGLGATHLLSRVYEPDTASLKFAEARGFKIAHHSFESFWISPLLTSIDLMI